MGHCAPTLFDKKLLAPSCWPLAGKPKPFYHRGRKGTQRKSSEPYAKWHLCASSLRQTLPIHANIARGWVEFGVDLTHTGAIWRRVQSFSSAFLCVLCGRKVLVFRLEASS